jgi:nitroreductase
MWKQSELERLNDAIYHRKCVRKFDDKPLSAMTLDAVQRMTTELQAVAPKSKAYFCILENSQVKGKTIGTAYYLAVYAERNLESFVNATFMLQQMDLWLSSQGIGSWWRGIRPLDEFATADGLPFVFMLTFGDPAEGLHRKDVSEFKRKPLSEITNVVGMERILEAVRLAPSAIDRQPWYVTGSDHSLRLYGKKDGFIMQKMFKDLLYIDIGIALCHLWLAATADGQFDAFERESDSKALSEKYEYIWTVKLRA